LNTNILRLSFYPPLAAYIYVASVSSVPVLVHGELLECRTVKDNATVSRHAVCYCTQETQTVETSEPCVNEQQQQHAGHSNCSTDVDSLKKSLREVIVTSSTCCCHWI